MRANERKEYAELQYKYRELIDLMGNDVDWSRESFYLRGGKLYITSIRITNRREVVIPAKVYCTGEVFIANCGLVCFENNSVFSGADITIRNVDRLTFGTINVYASRVIVSSVNKAFFGYRNAFFGSLHVYKSNIIQIEEEFSTGVSAVFTDTVIKNPPKVVKAMRKWETLNSDNKLFFKEDDVGIYYIMDVRDKKLTSNERELSEKYLFSNKHLWTLDKWMNKYTTYKVTSTAKDGTARVRKLTTDEKEYIAFSEGIGFAGETAFKARKLASMMLRDGEGGRFDNDYMRRVGIGKKIPFDEAMKAYMVLSDSDIVDAVLLVKNNRLINKRKLSFIDMFCLHDFGGGIKRLEERFNSLKQ